MEQTLILIKPDAVQRGLTGTIIERFERRGLKIVAMKLMQVDKSLAQQHYGVHKDKPFFDDLVGFITSSPIVAIVFEGKNAVEIARQCMGNTNSAQAALGTIRGDFGLDIQNNLVHGSDSKENAVKEISLFFSKEEILKYSMTIEKWITGS
jgi:nucleoside-diphosphate kinase